MKLRRILLVLLIAGILVIPAYANAQKNVSIYKAYVRDKYKYVGFTPEEIVIKTNWKVGSGFPVFRLKTLKIEMYMWCDLYHRWIKEDTKTFTNKFGMGTKPYHQEFEYAWFKYRKSWWAFWKPYYWGFVIKIPKTRDLIFHSSWYYKLRITLSGELIYGRFTSFEVTNFQISGYTEKFKVRPTPMNKYRQYWGSSASVNVANLNEAPTPNAYILSIDNETGTATFTMQPLTVEKNTDTVNEKVLLLGGALIVACVAVLIVIGKKK